jgi:hypothetical protein
LARKIPKLVRLNKHFLTDKIREQTYEYKHAEFMEKRKKEAEEEAKRRAAEEADNQDS